MIGGVLATLADYRRLSRAIEGRFHVACPPRKHPFNLELSASVGGVLHSQVADIWGERTGQ